MHNSKYIKSLHTTLINTLHWTYFCRRSDLSYIYCLNLALFYSLLSRNRTERATSWELMFYATSSCHDFITDVLWWDERQKSTIIKWKPNCSNSQPTSDWTESKGWISWKRTLLLSELTILTLRTNTTSYKTQIWRFRPSATVRSTETGKRPSLQSSQSGKHKNTRLLVSPHQWRLFPRPPAPWMRVCSCVEERGEAVNVSLRRSTLPHLYCL